MTVPGDSGPDTTTWQKTSYSYDGRNVLNAVTQYVKDSENAIDNITEYTHYHDGSIREVTAGISPKEGSVAKTTEYTYNAFGDVETITDAMGQVESYTYSDAGRLESKTDRKGNVTTYTLDALGREYEVVVTAPDGTEIITTTRYAPSGEVASKTETGTGLSKNQTYTYDEAGRLSKVVNGIGNYSDVADYTYTLGGQRETFTLTKGNSAAPIMNVRYAYTDRGLLKSVSEGGAEKASYTYTPGGRVLVETVNKVNKTQYAYNGLGLATYVVNGVKFDGISSSGRLIEVKDDYSSFIDKNGQFQSWFTGSDDLIDQARSQLKAANGVAIDWYVSNSASLNAMKDLFAKAGIKGINFIFQAPK